MKKREDKNSSRKIRRMLFGEACRYKRFSNHIAAGGDEDYGDNPRVPDLLQDHFREKAEELLESLVVSTNAEKEAETRGQSENIKWHEERSKRLTSTNFKEVVC